MTDMSNFIFILGIVPKCVPRRWSVNYIGTLERKLANINLHFTSEQPSSGNNIWVQVTFADDISLSVKIKSLPHILDHIIAIKYVIITLFCILLVSS